MLEVDVYPKLAAWFYKNKPVESWFCEVKLIKKGPFIFSSVLDHQIMNLTLASRGLYYKIPDAGVSRKPFDVIWTGVNSCQTYIVPVFYAPRTKCDAYLIPVNAFVKLSHTYPRKSIREEEIEFPKIAL